MHGKIIIFMGCNKFRFSKKELILILRLLKKDLFIFQITTVRLIT